MTGKKDLEKADSAPTTSRKLAVSLPADRTNVCVGADTYSIIMGGSDTDGKLSVMDFLVPPGGGPIPHAHACEETFLVLEGEVTVFCPGERISAPAGAAVNIPGWAPHAFRNLTTVPARLLCIISPAGLEEQFLEIGTRVPTRVTAPPPPDPKKIADLKTKVPAIVAKYHGRLLPPDTFDALMSEAERALVKQADGA
jgi:mannose-6-phosphate isomerase-like protein (cupin superfamily)